VALEYDPGSYEIQADPFPAYRWMQAEAPLYRNERLGFWALTRFDDVLAGLSDAETYSSAAGTQLESDPATMASQGEMMLFNDPPKHTVLRKLVNRAFTPRRVRELEDGIRVLCKQLLDDLAARGEGELVEDFAARVPMTVIGMLIGIPAADHDAVRHLTDRINHREPGTVQPPPDSIEAGVEVYRYVHALVGERRRAPCDDMATALVQAETDDDGRVHRLTDHQIVMFCILLALGGYETTTKLLANLAVALERFPDQKAALLADAALVPSAVEESLRHDAPSHYQGRVTTRPVTWYGTTVPEGSRILLVNGAANRDERVFTDPDRFDVRRQFERHLAFGHGVHHCLGANLARLEAVVALTELLPWLPTIEVDLDGLERRWSSNFRGWSVVPVRVGAR
jgi:cytochrome P450